MAFFDGFLGGLAQGIERGRDLKRQKEEKGLREKLLKLQVQQFENKLKLSQMQSNARGELFGGQQTVTEPGTGESVQGEGSAFDLKSLFNDPQKIQQAIQGGVLPQLLSLQKSQQAGQESQRGQDLIERLIPGFGSGEAARDVASGGTGAGAFSGLVPADNRPKPNFATGENGGDRPPGGARPTPGGFVLDEVTISSKGKPSFKLRPGNKVARSVDRGETIELLNSSGKVVRSIAKNTRIGKDATQFINSDFEHPSPSTLAQDVSSGGFVANKFSATQLQQLRIGKRNAERSFDFFFERTPGEEGATFNRQVAFIAGLPPTAVKAIQSGKNIPLLGPFASQFGAVPSAQEIAQGKRARIFTGNAITSYIKIVSGAAFRPEELAEALSRLTPSPFDDEETASLRLRSLNDFFRLEPGGMSKDEALSFIRESAPPAAQAPGPGATPTAAAQPPGTVREALDGLSDVVRSVEGRLRGLLSR